MRALAQHSSESVEHYTPAHIVELARTTLGEIDLDPASCVIAQRVVKAKHWIGDPGNNPGGLLADWHGRVFLNPPGGVLDRDTLEPRKRGGFSSAGVWWCKLYSEWIVGRVEQAIFVCFSMAVFRAAQAVDATIPPPCAFPFCVPRERINYDTVNERGERVSTTGAPADSAIVYLPPCDVAYYREKFPTHANYHDWDKIVRFRDYFSPLGYVRI